MKKPKNKGRKIEVAGDAFGNTFESRGRRDKRRKALRRNFRHINLDNNDQWTEGKRR